MSSHSSINAMFRSFPPKRTRFGWTFTGLFIALLAMAASAREIQAPSPEDVFLISYAISKTPPDFKALAKTSQQYQQASEFERPKIVDKTAPQLKKQYDAVADADTVVITIDDYLSAYDSDYKEYVMKAFSSDAFVSYQVFGKELKIHLKNAAKFADWHLDPTAAETVLNRNNKTRSIKLLISAKLLSARDESSDVRRVEAEITHVVVQSWWNPVELGHLP